MSSESKNNWKKIDGLDGDVCQIFHTKNSFGIILNDGIQFYNSSKRKFDPKLQMQQLKILPFQIDDNGNNVTFDAEQNLLYYYSQNTYSWSVINNKSKQSNKIYNSTGISNQGACGIIMNNQLHLFGGKFGIHHSYDPNSKQYKNIEDLNVPFVSNANFHASQSFIKSSDGLKIYLFHVIYAQDPADGGVMMLKYLIGNKNWEDTSIFLPEALTGFGAVSVKNDKFIIVFAGVRDADKQERENMNDIFVINVESKKLVKCKIKCPTKGSVRVAVGNDKFKQELITYGFVRNLWKNKQFNDNMKFPPFYLINLIVSYDQQEEVYLFWRYFGWRMSIDDLLKNTDFDSV